MAELWRERWQPSSKALRHYGAIIDVAAGNPGWVVALSPVQRQQARDNLADFSAWLADHVGGRYWKKKRLRSLAMSLALTTGGVALLITAPVSWPAILLAGAGGVNFAYDIADAAFQDSIQDRITHLLERIARLERESRGP